MRLVNSVEPTKEKYLSNNFDSRQKIRNLLIYFYRTKFIVFCYEKCKNDINLIKKNI